MVFNEEKKEKEGEILKKKTVWEKAREEISPEEKKELEKRKLLPEEEAAIKEQLKKEIELMELDKGLEEEAKKKAQKIEFLGEKEKLETLVRYAKERGVVFAVKVAKEMNDPYILDIFHDILAKEGFYKKFLK